MRAHPELRIFLWVALAFCALVILISGLSDLRMSPGEGFTLEAVGPDSVEYYNLPGGYFILLVIRVIYMLAMILAPILIIISLFSKKMRAWLIKLLFRALIIAAGVLALVYIIQRLFREEYSFPEGEAMSAPNPPYPAPPVIFNARPPQWITWLIIFILVIIITSIAGLIIWFIWRRTHPKELPLARIGREAGQALADLQVGLDLRDIVIRCYYEMGKVLNEERGIRRNTAMTPQEFAFELEKQGLPGGPVRQLTGLFEDVRYGNKTPGEREQQLATSSLSAIIAACNPSL